MKLEDRIAVARGLCRHIEKDLETVEGLQHKRRVGPEMAAAALCNAYYVLLHELREHITELMAHYEQRCAGVVKGRPKADCGEAEQVDSSRGAA